MAQKYVKNLTVYQERKLKEILLYREQCDDALWHEICEELELPIDSYEIKLKIAEAKENYDGMGVRNHD